MMTININKTDYTDEEVIAAVKAAIARGEGAVGDNNCHAGDRDYDDTPWERIDYTMSVTVRGDPLLVTWHMTEAGWDYAASHDGDDSEACNWDEIAEVQYA